MTRLGRCSAEPPLDLEAGSGSGYQPEIGYGIVDDQAGAAVAEDLLVMDGPGTAAAAGIGPEFVFQLRTSGYVLGDCFASCRRNVVFGRCGRLPVPNTC